MDEDVKICPRCRAEYYAHITECKTCEVALIRPGEKEKEVEVKSPLDKDPLVCVAEGDYEKMKAVSFALQEEGVKHKFLNAGSGKASCSSGPIFGIFSELSKADKTVMKVQDVWQRLYPSMNLDYDAGKCPECGAPIKGTPNECPDCGLNPTGHGGDCSDGGCGTC